MNIDKKATKQEKQAKKEKECTHETVKCTCCGKVGTPGQLMASRPRIRGEAAKEQAREAGKLGAAARKKVEEPSPAGGEI